MDGKFTYHSNLIADMRQEVFTMSIAFRGIIGSLWLIVDKQVSGVNVLIAIMFMFMYAIMFTCWDAVFS